jgi:hypothetical protein
MAGAVEVPRSFSISRVSRTLKQSQITRRADASSALAQVKAIIQPKLDAIVKGA